VGRGLRYDGPGTNLSGNPQLGGYPEFPNLVEPGYAFPSKLSWATSSPPGSSMTT